MTYCGELTSVKSRPDLRQATTLKCRSWTCPDCTDKRKAQLIAQAHRGKANTFITLTCRRDSQPSADHAALALSRAWRIISKRAVREGNRNVEKDPYPFGAEPEDGYSLDGRSHLPRKVRLQKGELQYLCVIEAHESGWPHLHILTRSAWIDHEWLSAQMLDLLDSPVVFVQRVHTRSQVNAYVAKYCGKCAHKFGTAKRYWQSAGYQLSKYEKPDPHQAGWVHVERGTTTVKTWAKHWSWCGFSVEWETPWHVKATPP